MPNSAGQFFGRNAIWFAFAMGLIGVPALNAGGVIDIVFVNHLSRYLCFAIVALGIDLIWGYTGILGLCQAMFFCLGGYCMGMHLALHGPLDGDGIPRCLYVVSSDVSGFKLPIFWEPFKSLFLTLVLGLLIPGVVGFIFGYFTFRSRVRGVYFSIITQATAAGVALVFSLNNMRLCGTNGLTNFETLVGYDLRTPAVKLGLYLLTFVVLCAVYYCCRHIVKSRLGRILVAIRDNESRLRFSGYQPAKYKALVFALSAMIAGLGGMLYSPQMGIITPSDMAVDKSMLMVVWVAVGGRASLSGAIIGALTVNMAYSTLTSSWPKTWPFFLGGLFIAAVLFFPNGLISFWHKLTGYYPNETALSAPPKPRPANGTAAAITPKAEEAKA